MYTKRPDEQGWYWVECGDGSWRMAYVDTGRETVTTFDGDSPGDGYQESWGFDDDDVTDDIQRWFGPLTCPGGDFGGMSVIKAADDWDRAKREKKAMVIVHVDYRYADGEMHGSSITSFSLQPREEADKYLHREREAIEREAK